LSLSLDVTPIHTSGQLAVSVNKGQHRAEQVTQLNQVGVGHMQTNYEAQRFDVAQLEMAQTARLLDPAQHFLDAEAGRCSEPRKV